MPFSFTFNYLSLFLVAIATQTTIPIPLDLLILGVIGTGFNPILTVTVATIGLTIGATLDYVFGRYGLALIPWFKKKKHARTYKRAEKFYGQYGQWTLLFSFAPFVGKYFPLLAGMMDASWVSFLFLYVVGKIIYYLVLLALITKIIKI